MILTPPERVGDECRLDVSAFAFCAEDLIDQLTFTHCVVDFYIEVFTYFAELCFVHTSDIDACLFFDRVDLMGGVTDQFHLH